MSIGTLDKESEKMIECPICGRDKILIEPRSHGIVTLRCSNCRKFIEYNIDAMSARNVPPRRGATKELNSRR